MRPPVSVRRLLVLLLIGALASAGPLAYASPPDPAWIAGFWDDGDYDDVVLLATSGVSIADPRPSYEPESVAVVIAVRSEERRVGKEGRYGGTMERRRRNNAGDRVSETEHK